MQATGEYRIGFAGSRLLYGTRREDAARSAAFDAALLDALVSRLALLPGRLGMACTQRPCGVSQMAIGADMLFSNALQRLGWTQRVLLPQAAPAFLADGDDGDPDFTPEEQNVARRLLDAPQVLEVRVASTSPQRLLRFEDTNEEIVRVSDAVVCLLREGAAARRGGTRDLMARALAAGKPVWWLEVSLHGGLPRLSDWHRFAAEAAG